MMELKGESVHFASQHETYVGGLSVENTCLIQQNRLLTNKIQLIEMQNLEQQRRLQQLEKLIFEIGANSIQRLSNSNVQFLDESPDLAGQVHLRCKGPKSFENKNVNLETLNCVNGLKTLECVSSLMGNRYRKPAAENHRTPEKLTATKKFDSDQSFFNHSQFFKGRQVSCSSGNEKLQQSDDVLSIMEEFDRTARENGVTYGMTPEGSVVSTDDLSNHKECVNGSSEIRSSFNHVAEENFSYDFDILTAPASELLTPSFQCHTPTLSQHHTIENGPMITPQSCLITPVLLTSEALRAIERAEDQPTNTMPKTSNPHDKFSILSKDSRKGGLQYFDFKKRKMQVFSNLLGGLNHMPAPSSCMKNNIGGDEKLANESSFQRCQNDSEQPFSSPVHSNKSINSSHVREWCRSMKHMFLSPMSESYGGDEMSVYPGVSPNSYSSGRIRDWSQSLKLSYLSPMSESHHSLSDGQLCYKKRRNDKTVNKNPSQSHNGFIQASEEEDLVIDEVVSLSMGGKRPVCNSSPSIRQRSESICSVTGPCVPPDLLLNTGMSNVSSDSDVEEEIAGLMDGDLPLDDSLIISDDGIISAPQEELDIAEEVNGDAQCENVTNINVDHEGGEELIIAEEDLAEEEAESVVETKSGGGFRNVADLIGSNSQSFTCKKISSEASPEKTLQVDGQDIKLQTGSIILAVVNESGTLVPLPPAKNSKVVRSLKVESSPEKVSDSKVVRPSKVESSPEKGSEDEIDVETVTEKAPVLEAGDLDSLLAQFEASEAVNTETNCKSNNSVSGVSDTKNFRQSSLLSNISTQKSPHGSPVHQKIKNALPKEVIEKIKASTKRKSTQMLSEPLIIRKGRGVKQPESNQHRKKSHRSTPNSGQSITNDRVPPPLDHDYCCSPDKPKVKGNDGDNSSQSGDYLNKLPDYYTVAVSKKDSRKASPSTDDSHDDSGKKDSGVESGDVSDASVETEDRKKELIVVKCGTKIDTWNKRKSETASNTDVYNKLPPYMTDIGNSKPKVETEEEQEKEVSEQIEQKQEVKKIKRKLNLSEYRQRIQSAHSSRCPSPSQTDVNPGSAPLSLGELIQKMKDAEEEKEVASSQEPEKNPSDPVAPTEDMEEGELKGDSDNELSKPTNVDDVSENLSEKKVEEKLSYGSSVPVTNPLTSYRESRKSSSSQGYASRRWSSSSHSRSRSRSRSPRRKHSSRYRRSSRGRRKGTRRRNSGSSVSSTRSHGWSRSKSRSVSRSRGRSSSECSCTSCSDSSRSRSRSRSRSHSSRKRERRHSRRYSGNWDRRRRSRSWSRSSRYSRGHRSRSPSWRNSRRSRSPSRRPARPRRPEDEDRIKQVEERRVIYVGRIDEGTTKVELRRRFQKFGTILDISVHFRERGDNYGFVTFKNKDEAYDAVEHGNDDPSYPHYDLCFGGRRAFCRVQYSDLDAQSEGSSYFGGSIPAVNSNADFDSLLRAAMKRKTR